MSAPWEAHVDPSALGEVRLPGGDVIPSVAPRTEEEWSAVIRCAASAGTVCLPLGRASALASSKEADLILSTANYAGVVAYEPGDGTLTARAGSTMQDLADTVSSGGHRLTPAVPRPGERTLGGVLGAASFGFDRLRFGPVRHNVLGMRVLLADGSIARTGGNLVKNVTGYDLHRLYTGSRGSLCVILEASLRLYPAPRASSLVAGEFPSTREALEAGRATQKLAIHPDAVFVEDRTLMVFLSGRPEVVRWETEQLTAQLPELTQEVEPESTEGSSAWERARDQQPGEYAIELATRPSRLAKLTDEVSAALRAEDQEPKLLAHPALGLATLSVGAEPRDLASIERLIRDMNARRKLVGFGADRAESLPAAELQQGLRDALDPEGLFVRHG